MKKVAWFKWIAGFDMEDLTSSLLRSGMLLSVSVVVVSLLASWKETMLGNLGPNLKANSVPLLILTDLQQAGSQGFWTRLLLHLGVAALLLTPYARVLASLVYFVWVDRSWKHAALTGLVLVILTIVLFTTLV